MSSSDRLVSALAVVISAGLLTAGAAANAQSGNEPAAPRGGAPPGQPGNAPAEEGVRAPLLRISSVEVMRSAHEPVMDIIRVRGLASTSGWEEVELVPLTRGVPPDGVLHFVLVGRAPVEAMEATGYETVEAIFPLETNHPFKGINVRSATDSVTVTSIPGYGEGKAAGEDCRRCVGKTLVARGRPAPAGKSAAELVREEELPPLTRVIGPTDWIAAADSNPNRLTLIVNKEGRITTAVWE